jgi:probable rRNA maturation factor
MSKNGKLALTLQFPDKRLQKLLTRKLLKSVVQAALVTSFAQAEITLRFVNEEEGRTLNRDYRGKDYATNVLTFPYSEDDVQADIVLCADVLEREAAEQCKAVLDHTLHLIVHGMLHAQGYDHENKTEALEMETLEVEILAKLGVKNPYQVA